MICVGIDVAKDKHDCFIAGSEGEVLADMFIIPNYMEGFKCLLGKNQACSTPEGQALQCCPLPRRKEGGVTPLHLRKIKEALPSRSLIPSR